MPLIKIKGETYDIKLTTGPAARRATNYSNKLLGLLQELGVDPDDVTITEERNAIRKAPASASWWMDEEHCTFSYNKMERYIDNLLVVLKVIETYLAKLYAQEISIEAFIDTFKEQSEVQDKRAEAREVFGLDENHVDLPSIDKQYKKLAKTLHPDMSTGDAEKFKELNEHHKTLRRELE